MFSLNDRKKNENRMDLLKAIQSQPFEKIKELVTAKGIPVDATWIDYTALNCSIEHKRKDVAEFLLDNRCRVNKISRSLTKPSNTPLHNAVKLGDAELVQKLLDKNASMTAANAQGNSPLHLAFIIREDKITDLILDFILQTATFANPKNNHGLTHLHIACTRKNAALVLSYMKIESNLTDTISEDSPYYPGYTVMQFAVEFKSPLILKLLLEHGGSSLTNQSQITLSQVKQDLEDVSVMAYLMSSYARTQTQSKISEFHMVCMQSNPALVNTFLSYGAAVNNPISEDASFCPLYTPLHYAAETNCKESVRLLLQHGADAEYQNAYYMTPLHVAMYNDQQEIAELLWASTKNRLIERDDRNGLSYFHAAVARNDLEVVRKYLDDKGQDVNARVFHNYRNFSGYTPLHFAVRYGHVAVAQLLVERGANVNANDMGQHGTPLHMAIAAGHRGLIDFFLKIGARLDARRPYDNKTMLHLLVEAYMNEPGSTEKLSTSFSLKRNKLLEYVEQFVFGCGLDVNAKDNDGYTALHYACVKISVGAVCAKVLLECGADINIENNVGDTPFEVSFYDLYRNNAEDYMLLYYHVKGLRTLGLRVNAKNEECCQKLLKEKNEVQEGAECFRTMHLVRKQQESVNEILKMKGAMVSKSVSVYQFVLMDDQQLKNFGGTDVLRHLVESKIIKDFVHFGYQVRLQWFRLQKLMGLRVGC